MRRRAAGLCLACILSLAACGQEDVLHLGLNAEIVEIDARNQVLYVRDPAPVSDPAEETFGERCAIDCLETPVLYCDYETRELEDIDLETLEVGDAVMLNVYASSLSHAPEGPVRAEQVQLGTQRLG